MSAAETTLRRHAQALGAHLQEKAHEDRRQIDGLQARLAILRESFSWTENSAERAKSFMSVLQDRYLCPECWIMRGQTVELRRSPSPSTNEHSCPACKASFELESASPRERELRAVG